MLSETGTLNTHAILETGQDHIDHSQNQQQSYTLGYQGMDMRIRCRTGRDQYQSQDVPGQTDSQHGPAITGLERGFRLAQKGSERRQKMDGVEHEGKKQDDLKQDEKSHKPEMPEMQMQGKLPAIIANRPLFIQPRQSFSVGGELV